MGMKETKDMDCISAKPLTESEMLRFLDGNSNPETVGHLQSCIHCKQRLDALQDIHGQLTKDLYRFQCPTPLELGEYHLRLISSESRQLIKAHLTDCLHCTRELDGLKGYLDQVQPDIDITPIERLKIIVAKVLGSLEGSSQGSLAPAVVGVRGTASSATMYEAGELQLNIELQKDPDQPGKGNLLGLALGTDVQNLVAQLYLDGEEIASSKLDELGNFHFQDLPTGAYALILKGPETEIHIPKIAV